MYLTRTYYIIIVVSYDDEQYLIITMESATAGSEYDSIFLIYRQCA